MRPVRVQLRRTAGWRKPAGAVIVARPSRWGNPFPVGAEMQITRALYLDSFGSTGCTDFRHPGGPWWWEGYETVVITPQIAVELYRAQLLDNLTDPDVELDPVRAAVDELRGRDLACWCPLDQPCHADVLLEVANRPEPWTLPE